MRDVLVVKLDRLTYVVRSWLSVDGIRQAAGEGAIAVDWIKAKPEGELLLLQVKFEKTSSLYDFTYQGDYIVCWRPE